MILTISGASCVGKDTIANFLFRILPKVNFLPSQTSRQPGVGDRGYVYVTREEILFMKERGMLAWDVEVFGNIYATKIADIVTASLDEETIWLSIVTPNRIMDLRSWAERRNGRVLSVHLTCNNLKILRQRLENRKREGDDIERRLDECRRWNVIASLIPEVVQVDNSGDIEFAKKAVVNLIKTAGFLDLDK